MGISWYIPTYLCIMYNTIRYSIIPSRYCRYAISLHDAGRGLLHSMYVILPMYCTYIPIPKILLYIVYSVLTQVA